MMKFSDFGFKENPFAITPDPRYLFLSRGHEESLAHLIYGTGPNGGFVLLTGEVGTGKTLLIRSLLAQQLSDVDIALVLNPRLSRREFLATICDELGIAYPGPPYSLKQLIDTLTRHLLKTHGAGRHTVLIVDEAQNLSPRVLEQIRLLTNLETTRHKLLRIILVGQPELLQMLGRKELRQVDQRITARYHLSPLTRQETAQYIVHRLAVAGIREDLYTPGAMRLIHRFSDGVPRRTNTLCERTLLAIFSRGRQRAGMALVWQAACEVSGRWSWLRIGSWVALPLLLAAIGTGVYLLWPSAAPPEIEQEKTVAAQRLEPPPESAAPASVGAAADGVPSVEPAAPAVPAVPASQTDQREPVAMASSGAGAEVPLSSKTAAAEEPNPAEAPIENYDLRQLFLAPQDQRPLFRKLFALWGESIPAASPITPCMQAPSQGLRCLRERGDWRQLEALNRPLLLRLTQEKRSRLLLLKVKDNDLLVVDDGSGEALLEIPELKSYWDGGYVMLWRPYGGVALIGEGSTGEVVTWLRRRLSDFDHQPVRPVEGLDRFDDALKQRLQAFQRTHGLLDDGVAGQQTLILLNNLAPLPGTPFLHTPMTTVEG